MTLAARRKRDAARFKSRDPRPEDEPVLAVIDATTIDEPTNSDEALALFALYATEDDTLTLHSEWCATNLSVENACSCTPVALAIGAKA